MRLPVPGKVVREGSVEHEVALAWASLRSEYDEAVASLKTQLAPMEADLMSQASQISSGRLIAMQPPAPMRIHGAHREMITSPSLTLGHRDPRAASSLPLPSRGSPSGAPPPQRLVRSGMISRPVDPQQQVFQFQGTSDPNINRQMVHLNPQAFDTALGPVAMIHGSSAAGAPESQRLLRPGLASLQQPAFEVQSPSDPYMIRHELVRQHPHAVDIARGPVAVPMPRGGHQSHQVMVAAGPQHGQRMQPSGPRRMQMPKRAWDGGGGSPRQRARTGRDAFKDDGKGGGKGYVFSPGDWKCGKPGCDNMNFARRTECHLCHAPRPIPGGNQRK